MTIIAAMTDGQTTWIGSDRLAGVEGERYLMKNPTAKWIVRNDIGFACSGSLMRNRIVAHHWDEIFSVPTQFNPFAAGGVIGRLMRENGIEPSVDEDYRTPLWGGHMLIVVNGQLWHFDSSMAETLIPRGEFVAIGSGASEATAAAWVVRKMRVQPKPDTVVCLAINAACQFNTDCEGPWTGKIGPDYHIGPDVVK